MDKTTVTETLIKIMHKKGIIAKNDNIDVTASLIECYDIDSMSFIEIIISLEQEYGFEFDEADLDINNFENVNTIVDTVLNHING